MKKITTIIHFKITFLMRHGSLFSGIGGFDLAAEWMGWENVFHCEWEEVGRKVLKYYWPNAISYGDITKTDFTIHRNRIDILTGGFPCQPYSSSGKRLGKEDARHLWPEMLRAIREIKPKYILGENVFGITNWNGGMVFNEVQVDLENEGYQIQPCVLPACAVNAPHRRDRVWFVAYSNECSERSSRKSIEAESDRSKNNDEQKGRGEQAEQHFRCSNVLRTNSDPKSESSKWGESKQQKTGTKEQGEPGGSLSWMGDGVDPDAPNTRLESMRPGKNKVYGLKNPAQFKWETWPIESPICSRNDGFPQRLDGITFPKWREQSVKAFGNAIVPQVAYNIFKAIVETESKINSL